MTNKYRNRFNVINPKDAEAEKVLGRNGIKM
jgi:hypothetical protein